MGTPPLEGRLTLINWLDVSSDMYALCTMTHEIIVYFYDFFCFFLIFCASMTQCHENKFPSSGKIGKPSAGWSSYQVYLRADVVC